MWTRMKDDTARQHIQIRDELRKHFQHEQGSDADLLYESAKLFKPITESTEKIQKALVTQQPVKQPMQEQTNDDDDDEVMEAAATDYSVVDPDYGLDVEALEDMGFLRPSRIKNVSEYDDIIEKVNHYNRYVLGRAKRGSVSEEREAISDKINANRNYVKRLRLLMSGQKLVLGKGMPLKLVGNKFGNLTIDKEELESGRLRAIKDGKTVIDEAADQSLYNLLTKRFGKTYKYSKNAVHTF